MSYKLAWCTKWSGAQAAPTEDPTTGQPESAAPLLVVCVMPDARHMRRVM